MELRTRLRKVVNKEGYLGHWRLALIRLIDPVEWYMRKNAGENPRPPRRWRGQRVTGWTAYAPLHERAVPPRPGARPEDRVGGESHLERGDSLRRKFASYFEARARELTARHQVMIETTEGTVRARLVEFHNGSVFEQEHTSPKGSGYGMTRLERSELSDPIPMIVGCLVQSVLSLGVDAVPLV